MVGALLSGNLAQSIPFIYNKHGVNEETTCKDICDANSKTGKHKKQMQHQNPANKKGASCKQLQMHSKQ